MGKLVTIIGNSGSGKTTLARRLEETGLYPVYIEHHTGRPFQAAFARDPRYGLANQIDYLLLCAEQELEIRRRPGIGIQDGGLDLDFHVYTVLFYQRGFLNAAEFDLCRRLYHTLRSVSLCPEVIIELSAPLAVAAQRKASRGRALDISAVDDLQIMQGLLENLRGELMRLPHPPRWITIDSGLEDERYTRCTAEILSRLAEWIA